jgi:hypothetical protein
MYMSGGLTGGQLLDSSSEGHGGILDEVNVVLNAATDFGDATAIDACRRVIAASGQGTPPAQSDLQLIRHYFR